LEKRGEERGEVYKKGGDRYRPKYRKSSKSDAGKIQNTHTEKTAGNTAIQLYSKPPEKKEADERVPNFLLAITFNNNVEKDLTRPSDSIIGGRT